MLLTDSEKAALNNILRRIRPTQQTQNTTVAEHELTDPEQKLITEALEVILKTPHITFSVFGIGRSRKLCLQCSHSKEGARWTHHAPSRKRA
jgi:hypothetical protein